MKSCRCGCGEPVRGVRRSKQYLDDAHRKRHRRAQEKEAAPVVEPEPDPFRDGVLARRAGHAGRSGSGNGAATAPTRPPATVERLAAGGSLARFAEGDAAASYERGRTLTTDQLLAVLEQLAT
jgi:hypothetical protein